MTGREALKVGRDQLKIDARVVLVRSSEVGKRQRPVERESGAALDRCMQPVGQRRFGRVSVARSTEAHAEPICLERLVELTREPQERDQGRCGNEQHYDGYRDEGEEDYRESREGTAVARGKHRDRERDDACPDKHRKRRGHKESRTRAQDGHRRREQALARGTGRRHRVQCNPERRSRRRGRLEEPLDEPGLGDLVPKLIENVEGIRRATLAAVLAGPGRNGRDRARGRSADVAEPVLRGDPRDRSRVHDATRDPSLHHEIAFALGYLDILATLAHVRPPGRRSNGEARMRPAGRSQRTAACRM